MLDDAARSTDPTICPFLRRDADGTLLRPWSAPADDHTCVAIGAPRPQSHRQQELVCLRTAHADCPRYQRGALAAAPAAPRRATPAIPRATLAALLILVLSAGISFGFVVQRGGIGMPVVGSGSASPAATSVALAATPAPEATGAPVATEVPASLPGASPSMEPTLAPTAPPTATPAATPAPTIAPTAEPTPRPTRKPAATPRSDRYAVLKKCPDRKGCWIYTVRAGDNLFSIANYFGHSLAVIYDWNPQYPETRLKSGAQIRMPPPKR